MAEPEPGGTKASGFLSIALNKCGKIRNKCKLSLVVVLLVCRKKKKKKTHKKVNFPLYSTTNVKKEQDCLIRSC